jgi:hypothetical protein
MNSITSATDIFEQVSIDCFRVNKPVTVFTFIVNHLLPSFSQTVVFLCISLELLLGEEL